MRLDPDQDGVEGLARSRRRTGGGAGRRGGGGGGVAARGRGLGEQGADLRRDHGKEGLVDVGADVGRREVGGEFGDGVAEAGAGLGRHVDGDLERAGGFEHFLGRLDAVVVVCVC